MARMSQGKKQALYTLVQAIIIAAVCIMNIREPEFTTTTCFAGLFAHGIAYIISAIKEVKWSLTDSLVLFHCLWLVIKIMSVTQISITFL